jgi:hypothetical protein
MLADTLFIISRGGSETGGLLYAGLRGVLVFLVGWLGQLAAATLVQAAQRAEVASSLVTLEQRQERYRSLIRQSVYRMR